MEESRSEFSMFALVFLSHNLPFNIVFQLPSESTNLLDDEEDVLTFNDPSEPDTSREINQDEAPIVTVEPTRYHDDSDEDLLA